MLHVAVLFNSLCVWVTYFKRHQFHDKHGQQRLIILSATALAFPPRF
jgi:hypothetical protein